MPRLEAACSDGIRKRYVQHAVIVQVIQLYFRGVTSSSAKTFTSGIIIILTNYIFLLVKIKSRISLILGALFLPAPEH